MSRNSSGTYSLYTPGNPVVTSTVISSTWANNTLTDIATALTDSLSRSGDGGMSAPLELANGAIGAPGLTWGAEQTSGFYRQAAGNFRFAIGGVDVFTITAAGITGLNFTGFANPTASAGLAAVNGSATTAMRSDGAPAISQSIAPTWTGTHIFGNTTAQAIVQNASAGTDLKNTRVGTTAAGVFSLSSASDAAPTTAVKDLFSATRTTTAWTALSLGNATDNTTFTFLGTGLITAGGVYRGPNGSVTVPTFAFTNDIDTGIYLVGAGSLDFTAGGVQQMSVIGAPFSGTNRVISRTIVSYQDGLVSAPPITFENDLDLGIYRIGSNDMGVSAGNSLVFEFLAAASGGAKVADFGGTLQNVGYREVPQNSQSANYTLVLADSGKHIYHPSGGGAGDTFTIPANGSVAYALGTVLTFVNADSNAISIAITTDTMTLAGTTTTGTRTLAQNGIATAIKHTTTGWIISGTGLT